MSPQVVLETHTTYYLVSVEHLSCGLSCRDKRYFFSLWRYRFSENGEISNFMKIRQFGSRVVSLHVVRRMAGRSDMTKLS